MRHDPAVVEKMALMNNRSTSHTAIPRVDSCYPTFAYNSRISFFDECLLGTEGLLLRRDRGLTPVG